jgi:hypothetical protein
MSAPDASDLLTGNGARGSGNGASNERYRAPVSRSDVALMKIMWERVGWPEPDESITEIPRKPSGRTEEQRRRPRIVPPGRNDALLYYSPSNTSKLPSSNYLLHKYDLRQVLLGAALDEGIREMALAHQDDKDELNRLAWLAQQRAKSELNAQRGTARHKVAEKLDFGIDVGTLDRVLHADMKAYRGATQDLDMVLGEMFVVDDEHRMGGSFDRVVYYHATGRYYIADLKPPESGFGQDEHAIQFAIYSRCLLYNWNLAEVMLRSNQRKELKTTQLRAELPQPLDQERAIVIYVPRGGIGRAHVAWVNIAAGWEGFQHAQWMRHWQRQETREGLIVPFTPKAKPVHIDVAPAPADTAQPAPTEQPASTEQPAADPAPADTAAPEQPAPTAPPEQAPPAVERPKAVAAPHREHLRDGRPITDVALPGMVAGVDPDSDDPLDQVEPDHPVSKITHGLRSAHTLDDLKAVWAQYGKTKHWQPRHLELYRTRRIEITGQPLPERIKA